MNSVMIPVAGGDIFASFLGKGPMVLLLHGWACDQRMWQPQIALADAGYQVVMIDRRGFGRSTAPANITQELEDVSAVLDHFGVERANIIGMSQGGRIALRFAHAHPDKIDHLILQGAPIDGIGTIATGDEAIPLNQYKEMLAAGEHQAFVDHWSGHPLLKFDMAYCGDMLRNMAMDYQGNDLLRGAADSYDQNILKALETLSIPSLYLYGDHDTSWLKSVAKRFDEAATNGRSQTIKDAGHFCNASQPDTFNQHVLSFLKGA